MKRRGRWINKKDIKADANTEAPPKKEEAPAEVHATSEKSEDAAEAMEVDEGIKLKGSAYAIRQGVNGKLMDPPAMDMALSDAIKLDKKEAIAKNKRDKEKGTPDTTAQSSKVSSSEVDPKNDDTNAGSSKRKNENNGDSDSESTRVRTLKINYAQAGAKRVRLKDPRIVIHKNSQKDVTSKMKNLIEKGERASWTRQNLFSLAEYMLDVVGSSEEESD